MTDEASESEEFAAGLRDGFNPEDLRVTPSGHAVTSLHSPWLHCRCPGTGHSFRIGDRVHVGADRVVRHASEGLRAGGGSGPEQATSTETRGFYEGLDDALPPPEGVPLTRLVAGHLLLAEPVAGMGRHCCAVCGHTLRSFELVVICPCSPAEPRCLNAIHRDPSNRLQCWEAWQASHGETWCLSNNEGEGSGG